MDEAFARGSSLIHRLDPRVKFLAAVLFSVEVAVAGDLRVLLLALPFPVTLLALARLSPKAVLKRLLLVNGFILFLWVFIPLGSWVGPTMEVWFLRLPANAVRLCLLMTLKTNLIIGASIALLSTTPILSLVHALRHLHLPDKLVQVFFFCWRYLHVLEEELARLLGAMKVRGFEPRTDLHTYRSYGYLVGSLLLKAADRSERVYQAMVCRGFEGKFWMLDHFQMARGDYVALVLLLGWCLLLGGYQWFLS